MSDLQSSPPPTCSACGVEREPFGAEHATRQYEIRTYRCPQCRTDLRLVEYVEAMTKTKTSD
ncbi:MAG: hypothetical protein C0480_06210 [Bradyrhizobium sp.]|nr:hypothetical protein [Bradyrhizobium sp.]